MSDSLIPGTVLQRGTPWLATMRMLPEPRLPQNESVPTARPGRLASMLSALAK